MAPTARTVPQPGPADRLAGAPTPPGSSPGAAPARGSSPRRSQAAPPTAESALQERLTPRQPVRAFLGLGIEPRRPRAYLRAAVDRFPTSPRCRRCTRPTPSAVLPARGRTSTAWWSCGRPGRRRELLVGGPGGGSRGRAASSRAVGPAHPRRGRAARRRRDRSTSRTLIVPHPRCGGGASCWSPSRPGPGTRPRPPHLELARGIRAAGNL